VRRQVGALTASQGTYVRWQAKSAWTAG